MSLLASDVSSHSHPDCLELLCAIVEDLSVGSSELSRLPESNLSNRGQVSKMAGGVKYGGMGVYPL